MLQNPERGIALVVDDEPTNRQMMHMMLTNLGYETYTAENGQIAVDTFQQHRVDLVFMDLMMPVMDGKEATRQIKALSDERFVPVIFLSASNDLDELSKCIAAGGDDFLNKPCHPTVLKSKIRAMERIRDLHNKVHDLYQEVSDLHGVMSADERLAEKIFNQVVLADNIHIPGLEHFQRSPETFSGDVLLSASRPNGDVLLLLGDLTGHGLSAAIGALPMAEVFRTMTLKGHAEEEILKEINSKLYNLLPTDRFVSMALITLFHNKQVATVWNAGLPDIYLIDGNNKIKQTIKSVHPPLGVMRQLMSQPVPEVLMTEIGDRLLGYTDGLTEANNLSHEEYGEQRLCETIEHAFPGEPVFSQIMHDFDQFREGVAPRDDISILEIPSNTVVQVSHIPLPEPTRNATYVPRNNWRWQMELFAANLGHTDPIPMAM
ncbi:MAG TPA: serine/threonine protein phosphatase [Oceanospirillaceae bacterium]|nr:serine/threonine protein phosphatase [Oceanospirillaceae bacterium]